MNPPSPPQPADSLEKRRKQIEKAKAAHLSRQLQTRLQYARLKVDHGWQKQTLNEVENLYFHHYRARIPPPRSILKPEKSATSATETQSTSELPANAASTSNEQRSPSLPIPDPSPTPNVPEEGEQTAMEVDLSDEGPTASTSGNPSIAAALGATAPPPQQKPPSPPVTEPSTAQRPPPQRPPATTETPPLPAPPAQSQVIHTAYFPAPPMPMPTFAASTSRNSSYSQAQSAPMGSRGPSPSQRPSPSMMSSSLPGNSSNVALTYDSFWSSHSSTSNGYRSALASATPFAPVGDGGMGLQNFGGGFSFAMGAPAKLPIPRRPGGVVRKRTMPAPAGNIGHGVGAAEGGG